MSQGRLRLARMLILEHFGPVTEAVAWTLLTKGRLTLNNLSVMLSAQPSFVPRKRKLELSGAPIPNRSVREALFVLVQHNIVTYAEAVEGANRPPVVYYSISLDAVLDRLRIPGIIENVVKNHGTAAGAVIQAVFTHGRLSLSYMQAEAPSNSELNQFDIYDLHKAFNLLANKGYLIAVNEFDSQTASDLRIATENSEIDSMGPIPSAKMMTEAKRKAEDKAKAQYDSKINLGGKRKADDFGASASSSKKRRVDFEDSLVDSVDETVFWKVDLERCLVFSRNEMIVHLVERHVNDVAGAIVREVLEIVTEKMRNVTDLAVLPSVSAYTIARKMTRPRDHFIEYGAQGDRDFERVVGDYLTVLSTDFPRVLMRAEERGVSGGQFTVNFAGATEQLRLGEVLRVIEQKMGAPSARIWKIVLEKNKLDDKQVSKLAMIAPKEARERLYNLFRSKFLHLQTVPKGSDRSPQRTFHLYYTSIQKTSEIMLHYLYASVAKIRVRLAYELSQRARLMEKLKKTEADEEGLAEQDKLNRDALNKLRSRLEVAENRLSDMILVFRDA